MNKKVIDCFLIKGDFGFLSNFYQCTIIYKGIEYPSVEHAYQAQKTEDNSEKLRISKLKTPKEAKHAGYKLKIPNNWNDIKLSLMEELLRLKFSIPELHEALQLTKDYELIEGNIWGDKYWGICNGIGENNLGKLLMKIRDEQNDL